MRCGLALVLLLALGALAPTAEARHPYVRDLAKEVRGGAPVHLFLNETGNVAGDFELRHTEDEGGGSMEIVEESSTFRYQYRWKAYLTLQSALGRVQAYGTSSVDALAKIEEVERSRHEDGTIGNVADHKSRLVCEMSFAFGGRDGGRAVGATGTLTAAGLLDLAVIGVPRVPDQPDAWDPCERTWETTAYDQPPDSGTDAARGPTLAASVFIEDAAEGGSDGTARLQVPLLDGRTSISRTLTYDYGTGQGGPARELCVMLTSSHDGGTGVCRATGTMEVRMLVSPCGFVATRYQEHLAVLRAVEPIPADAPEAWVRAWVDARGEEVRDALGDARTLQLVCEDAADDDLLSVIGGVMDLAYDALDRILREQGLSPEGFQTLIGIERQRQLLGASDGDGTFPMGDLVQSGGRIRLVVNSPVSLHAFDAEGNHVGWNDATGAPEVGIEGATYEGEPWGWQRITLPGGFYKMRVDELADAPYLLEVDWNGDGVSGNESFFATAEPGRSTMSHYAFDLASGSGERRFDIFPVKRIATPAAHAFVDDAVDFARPPTSGSQGPTGGSGAEDDDDAPSSPPRVDPPPAAPQKKTAAPGAALAMAALALALAARRVARRGR